MSPAEHEITHVSDTALMVAGCRALETNRPDGFVSDPFAERLAGSRGMGIITALPRAQVMCFGIGIRSRFLDELVLQCVNERGVKAVLSIGCGLDSRPYRLDLPSELRWVEVDFPEMLDYKSDILKDDTPKCRLERMPADLSNAAEREAVFASIQESPSVVITEGLLMYLPASAVEALAKQQSKIRYWLSDITTEAFARRVGMSTYKSIQDVRASDSLSGDDILATILSNGWKNADRRSYLTDLWSFAGPRIQAMVMAEGKPAQEPPPISPDDPTGVHLFERY